MIDLNAQNIKGVAIGTPFESTVIIDIALSFIV